jgi:TetR/AcrR family transcriptional regulator, cholesterol catabolism regulator
MATREKPRSSTELIAAAEAARQRILDSGLPLADGDPEPAGRGGETKGRILDTAIAIFGERGFEACTMRDLAAEVGIKAPAIYNHYSSKEDVLAASMEHILGRFLWTLMTPLEGMPVEEWLEQIVQDHVRFQLVHRRLSRANDALLNAPGKKRILPPPVYKRIVGVERSYVDLLGVLVCLAAPESDKWDGMMSGFAIVAMCDRVASWYDPEGELSIEQVAGRSWKLTRQMIGA